MPTIWDPATRTSLQQRADRLTTSATPRWGRMHVAGMLAHLNDSTRMAIGELPVATIWLPIRYPPLRQIIIYLMPIPKSAPTAPELIARVDTADLAAEQQDFHACMERLGHITSGSQLVPHPAFGNLSFREYGVLIAKHTDHHLRQFGV
ncbi:MAG: DinB family protein [Acidobacteria bacterium]|nr:DinB family protein [Acidobacteriota bacterium]